jgi:hypothetical protein
MNLVDNAGADRRQFFMAYGINEETKEVALYVVPPDTLGAMPVRVYKKSLSFHLGNAFEECPALRPEAKASFPISDVTDDADGVPCVIITLKAGLDTRKTRTTAAAQNEPGAQ